MLASNQLESCLVFCSFDELFLRQEKAKDLYSSEEERSQLQHCVPKPDKAEQLFKDYKQRIEKLRKLRTATSEVNHTLGKKNLDKYNKPEEIKKEFGELVGGFFKFAKVCLFLLSRPDYFPSRNW